MLMVKIQFIVSRQLLIFLIHPSCNSSLSALVQCLGKR
ncbi:hypothetical protein E2C01_066343 [Portunus trituberculatus]|uniref:Uncharacterized protein n=1 Tax=Portunus trituberculatus TaxID=210409 RepID=A0A5B7HHY9_PORTR|nr:hypothetical protein [Portunus trituberculatus]